MSSMDKLQEVHDRLVASRPQDASCPEGCPFCSGEFASLVEGGPQVADKIYSDEDVQALVTAAVATATEDLQSKLTAIEAGEQTAAVQAQIDDAKTQAEAQIEELTAKLDAAVLEAAQATKEREELSTWLQGEHDRVLAEAEMETKRADRIAKVAEVVTFPEAHVAERADMWAALEDEKFEALLADYKALGDKTPKSEPLPRFTAMQASREANEENTVVGSALKDLIRGRQFGINDPRAIR